jgi:hypothetical protein
MQNRLPIPTEAVTCYHPIEPSCLIREWGQSYDRLHFRDRHQFFTSPSESRPSSFPLPASVPRAERIDSK